MRRKASEENTMAKKDGLEIEELSISEISLDPHNANRGNERGKKLIKNSLKKYGAGRSILLDANNTVISGNQTLVAAKSQGFKKVQIIDVDGDTLVAVRRKDLNLEGDKKARELAIAENRTQQVNLTWDQEILRGTDADLAEFFEPIELDDLLNEGKNRRQPNTIDLQPPPKMIWTLVGVPFNRFDLVQEHLAALEAVADISVQSARDE